MPPARRKLTPAQLIRREALTAALALVNFLLATLNISVEVARLIILMYIDGADYICNGFLRILRSAVERLEEANEGIEGPCPLAERASLAYANGVPRRSLSAGVSFNPGMRRAHLEEDANAAVRRTLSAGVSFPSPSSRPDPSAIRAIRKQPSQAQTVHADLQEEVQGTISTGPSGASNTQHPDIQAAPAVSDAEAQDDYANIWTTSTPIAPWNYLDPRTYKQPENEVHGLVDQAAIHRDSGVNEILNGSSDSEDNFMQDESSSGDMESVEAVSIDKQEEELLAAIADADTETAFTAEDLHNDSNHHRDISHAWTTVGSWLMLSEASEEDDVALEGHSNFHEAIAALAAYI